MRGGLKVDLLDQLRARAAIVEPEENSEEADVLAGLIKQLEELGPEPFDYETAWLEDQAELDREEWLIQQNSERQQ